MKIKKQSKKEKRIMMKTIWNSANNYWEWIGLIFSISGVLKI